MLPGEAVHSISIIVPEEIPEQDKRIIQFLLPESYNWQAHAYYQCGLMSKSENWECKKTCLQAR